MSMLTDVSVETRREEEVAPRRGDARDRVSIVMPTLDEAHLVEAAVRAALAQANDVVVADGGSSDGSAEVARRAGARVVTGVTGRGAQLNHGAAAARGEILLFLHADTRLPPAAVEAVCAAVDRGFEGGGFLISFATRLRSMRLGARLVNWRTRIFHVPLGDQAQWSRRDTFSELGGFPDWPLLEDSDFVRRLRRRARMAILSPPVSTDARRFERRGVARTVATNWLIWLLWGLGVRPQRLLGLYRKVR
jgi:rSAM/selenodomain-associated transferase 2